MSPTKPDAIHTGTAYEVDTHAEHPRLYRITVDSREIEEFFQLTSGYDVQKLEYIPFARLMVAKNLAAILGQDFVTSLRAILQDRQTGGFTISLANNNLATEDFVIFSTAVSHLVGIPNHDAMGGSYYVRFVVKDTDDSDSYLRKAYNQMSLHTDGTYVAERTDWLLMMKMEERNARGGRSRLLHLDDWEALDEFSRHPLASHPFEYKSPPSKNVSLSISKPTFFEHNGRPCLCFIDQFVYPQTMAEATYLHDLLESMENSPATRPIHLAPGELIMINNGFWVHGREAFHNHPALYRELLRQRGYFFPT